MARGGRTKNLRYGMEMDDLEDLLSSTTGNDDSLNIDDMEDVYELDIELMSKDANTLASSNIQNLIRCYNNKEFLEEHPDFKRRIDTEIESLRKLYKMEKMDETIHDHLAQSIAKNPGNASLYRNFVDLERNMISIDKEIRDRINNFNKIISSYQLELNFADQNGLGNSSGSSSTMEDGSVVSRGSKNFIESMKEEMKENEDDQPNLFEDDM